MISKTLFRAIRRFSTAQDTGNKITIREAINRALEQQMRRDKNIFIIGEEVGQYQGAYKVTKGLLEKFGPERIVDTPITEAGFTGLASGASLMGLHPVVQFMTMNFALQAIDHIVNSSAKLRYMSSGILSGAIVFRGLNGPAASVAAQHSQCFAAWYGSIPGLITVSPYTAQDHIGLTKMALRSKDPVMILENEYLYGETFDISQQAKDEDFLIPFGKAKVEVEGNHVTIVAYSRNVKFSLEAAAKLKEQGINAEVINLRSIKPLDRETIINSVKKTHRLVTVEDNYSHYGVGGQIAATIFESAFDELDAPVQRITAIDIPMPYSMPLEDMVTPKAKDIIQGVKKVLQGVRLQ